MCRERFQGRCLSSNFARNSLYNLVAVLVHFSRFFPFLFQFRSRFVVPQFSNSCSMFVPKLFHFYFCVWLQYQCTFSGLSNLKSLWLQAFKFPFGRSGDHSASTHSLRMLLPRARKGGLHQRLMRQDQEQQQQPQEQRPDQAQEARRAPHSGSKLADQLLVKWAWGNMSLPTVQLLAHAAVHDGLRQPLLRFVGVAFFRTHQT